MESTEAGQRRPNVVVFFTDQQRHDTTGVHGCPLDLTPNFDRMAMAGTHVAHSFTCQPVCGPARSCLQTGLYATQTGCWRNGIGLPDTLQTLAHHFGAAGYQTGYIGKWHLARDQKSNAVAIEERGGYDYWLAANALEFSSDAYDCRLYDNDNQEVKLPGYRVDALTDAAIRFIDERQDDPFFLFLSFLEPHHQNHRDDYPAPDGYAERYTGKWIPPDLAALPGIGAPHVGGTAHQHLPGYFGMVKRLDEALGRLLDTLTSLGIRDNTIVLFTSDHGSHFKTRNSEYKRSCHEASIRVPTAISGACFTGGGRLRELVSLVDLPPTLLDAAGIPVPAAMQGQSLLPLLRGSGTKADWPEEVFVQISESQVGRCVRTHRWKYNVVAPDKNGNKEASSSHYVEEFLYDLQADPYELTNLVAQDSHTEVRAVLRERLIARMVAAGEEAPAIEPAAEQIPSGQRRVTPEEARA
ncbi:MAG: sulfatase-like hydrolase/transferase [Armatimonadota bacterium]